MFSRFLLLTGFVATLVVPTTAFAQSTFTWNFGTAVANPLASSSSGTGALAGPFTIANSFVPIPAPITTTNPSTGYAGASGQFNIGIVVSSAAFSVTTTPYFSVFLDGGVNGIQLNDYQFGFSRGTTGAGNYSLRTSTDAFAVDHFSSPVTSTAWRFQANGTTPTPFNLGTGNVELRLYVFNGTLASPSAINTQLDDVTIFYTPVPEPATMLSLSALGLGAVGLVRRIRRTAVVAS